MGTVCAAVVLRDPAASSSVAFDAKANQNFNLDGKTWREDSNGTFYIFFGWGLSR